MKIGDNLEGLENSSVRAGNERLNKATKVSPFKRFEEILSSSLVSSTIKKKLESTGSLIANYLANHLPVLSPGDDDDTWPLPEAQSKHPGASLTDLHLSNYLKWLTTENRQEELDTANQSSEIIFPKNCTDIPTRQKIYKSVKEASAKYNLPTNVMIGVIKAESDFQVRTVSSKGAQGLMQLMPETAKELGVKDPFDIDQNIDGGARYLRKMLDLFGGDLKLALAAYNSGPETVKRYNGIPPYKETTRYVERVFKFSKMTV